MTEKKDSVGNVLANSGKAFDFLPSSGARSLSLSHSLGQIPERFSSALPESDRLNELACLRLFRIGQVLPGRVSFEETWIQLLDCFCFGALEEEF